MSFDANADETEFQNIKLTNTVNNISKKEDVVEEVVEDVDWDDI